MAEHQRTRAIMIVEIAGRPAEHVKESLKQHVNEIDKRENANITSVNINEPKKIQMSQSNTNNSQAQQEMFTCFAEVEVETDSFSKLIEIVFDFMPSSVELIKPDTLKLNIEESTSFVNNLAGRLHRYDEIAKVARLQSQQLGKRLQLMEQELIKTREELNKKRESGKASKKKKSKKKSKKSKKDNSKK